jgi:glycosyltransferase involved in cell wall biosynthesis
MKISIVIPTLNEEVLLPKLLDSIFSQGFADYEIIVADAHSTDHTREIAISRGCRVVDGGKPAAGRNAGARAANGEFLFFFDADVVLPEGFIRTVYDEMQDKYLDLATCAIRPLSDYQLDRIIHRMMNLAVLLNLWIDPKAFGFCIFVTKRLFERVNGFDETIFVAEDSDFVKRASAFRSLHYLNAAHIMVSVRRFEKEGRFAYMKKGIKLNLHRTFRGEIRNDEVVDYEFDAFDKTVLPEDKKFLDRIEDRLLRLEEHYKQFQQRAHRQTIQTNKKQLLPRIDEYSHVFEELETYFKQKPAEKQDT